MVDSGERVIIAFGDGNVADKAQFILANNYPDQNLSEEGLHWQWQTDLILGDDAALLQLFENDIKRDELRYGSDFGKLAENDSTQDSVYVLKREGYEKGQNTSDYPEYAKQAKDWEQQGDIALIKGDYVLRELHLKRYELKDHLGNVRVIVADVKDATLGLQGQPREFAAILKHYSNYYPFGMEKPSMVYDKGGYRYGFNGKENDDEVKGVGNHQDYGMRVYDPRIAKFLSVDPLEKDYPWNSVYAFAEDDVIRCVDLDGGEKLYYYYVEASSAENGLALFGHNAIGVQLNENAPIMYYSAGGAGIANDDGSINEAETIKYYNKNGRYVIRLGTSIPSELAETIGNFINDYTRMPGSNHGAYCTDECKYILQVSLENGDETMSEENQKRLDALIPNGMPWGTPTSNNDAAESGYMEKTTFNEDGTSTSESLIFEDDFKLLWEETRPKALKPYAGKKDNEKAVDKPVSIDNQ